jgi:hypothetical protein
MNQLFIYIYSLASRSGYRHAKHYTNKGRAVLLLIAVSASQQQIGRVVLNLKICYILSGHVVLPASELGVQAPGGPRFIHGSGDAVKKASADGHHGHQVKI